MTEEEAIKSLALRMAKPMRKRPCEHPRDMGRMDGDFEVIYCPDCGLVKHVVAIDPSVTAT